MTWNKIEENYPLVIIEEPTEYLNQISQKEIEWFGQDRKVELGTYIDVKV